MASQVTIVEVDSSGNLTHIVETPVWTLRVNSEDYAPKNAPKGSEVFIIDLQEAAFCDGKGNWYGYRDGGVVSITGGQTWAELYPTT